MSHSRGACVALARYLCSSAYERMPDRSSCLWKLLAASPAHAAR